MTDAEREDMRLMTMSIRELRDELRRARALLRRVQHVDGVCPVCASPERESPAVVHLLPIGHAPDCELAAVLGDA